MSVVRSAEPPAAHRPGTEVADFTPQTQLDQLAALTELQALVQSCESPELGCRSLACDLARYLQADFVAVGLCDRKTGICRVRGTSTPVLDARDDASGLVQAVLQEVIARDSLSLWPPTESRQRHGLMAHRRYLQQLDSDQVLSTPLRDASENVVGALLIHGDPKVTALSNLNFITAAERPLASSLGLLVRAHGNRMERALRRLSRCFSRRRIRIVVASLIATALLLIVPMRYRVRCRCELQPTIRRFVAAPFDGRLEKSFVEPGQVVSPGQLLARIDGRDVNWKLSEQRAQLHRVNKERAGYLAAHKSAHLEIATIERDRLALAIQHLEEQKSHLEIRSPLGGLVVQGDLAKSQGMPLEQGIILFEIAPLKEMVMEVAIPESDVRFVQPGMLTTARLDAYPHQPREGFLRGIHPRSELRDGDNVFIGEFRVDNQDGRFRPGMRGTARVITSKQPLGWILFHRAFETLVSWVGW